jgi:hypothetical protein
MPPPARPKKTLALTGIAALVGEFEDPKRSEENDETSAAATSARLPGRRGDLRARPGGLGDPGRAFATHRAREEGETR